MPEEELYSTDWKRITLLSCAPSYDVLLLNDSFLERKGVCEGIIALIIGTEPCPSLIATVTQIHYVDQYICL